MSEYHWNRKVFLNFSHVLRIVRIDTYRLSFVIIFSHDFLFLFFLRREIFLFKEKLGWDSSGAHREIS